MKIRCVTFFFLLNIVSVFVLSAYSIHYIVIYLFSSFFFSVQRIYDLYMIFMIFQIDVLLTFTCARDISNC